MILYSSIQPQRCPRLPLRIWQAITNAGRKADPKEIKSRWYDPLVLDCIILLFKKLSQSSHLCQRILTYRGSITVLLTCLDGLDAIRQVNILLFNKSKAAESKQVKLEVSHADIFPLRVSNPCLCVLSK